MEQLHIVTPVSRPQNIKTIYESIIRVLGDMPWLWWVVLDLRHADHLDFAAPGMRVLCCRDVGVVGHCCRNKALDQIVDGLVYQLDDDTIVHSALRSMWDRCGNIGIFFEQVEKDLNTMHVAGTAIDTGSVILPRTLIGSARFDPSKYDADQGFFRPFYDLPGREKIPVVAAIYNALR